MKTRLLYLILLILTVSSCKKEEKEIDLLSLLTSKPWKPAMTDKNPGTGPAIPGSKYHAWQDCEKDDRHQFNANQLNINRGTTKCEDDEASAENFDYHIDFANKKITIDGFTYELAEISETQLKYYHILSAATGYNHAIIYILEH